MVLMRDVSCRTFAIVSSAIVISFVGAHDVIAGERLGPPGGPKYLTCPVVGVVYCSITLGKDVNNDNTKDGCTKYCQSPGPLRLTPVLIEGCAGVPITGINVEFDGQMGSGNAIVSNKGEIDWNDGTTTNVWTGPKGINTTVSHTYLAAKTYYPSAIYAAQFAYTGQGSCGYYCNIQAQAVAQIYLATSPQCSGGRFHKLKRGTRTPASN